MLILTGFNVCLQFLLLMFLLYQLSKWFFPGLEALRTYDTITKNPSSLWVWTDQGLLMGCRIAAKVDSFSSSVLNGLEWKEMRRGIISLQMPHNSQRTCLLGASIIYLSIALNFKFILAYRNLNRKISD